MPKSTLMLGFALAMVVAVTMTAEQTKVDVVMEASNTAEVMSASDPSTTVKDQRVGVFPLRNDTRFDPAKLELEWHPPAVVGHAVQNGPGEPRCTDKAHFCIEHGRIDLLEPGNRHFSTVDKESIQRLRERIDRSDGSVCISPIEKRQEVSPVALDRYVGRPSHLQFG